MLRTTRSWVAAISRLGATGAVSGDLQKLSHLVDGEAEVAAAANKDQPLHVGSAIDAVTAGTTVGTPQQIALRIAYRRICGTMLKWAP